MDVLDIMHDRVVFLSADATLRDAAKKCDQNRDLEIVVKTSDGIPVGVVTRDDVVAALAAGAMPDAIVGSMTRSSVGSTLSNVPIDSLVNEPFDRWVVYDEDQIAGLLRRSDFDVFLLNTPDHIFALLDPLLDCVDEPIVIINNQCRVVVVNAAACKEFKAEREDILGQAITNMFGPSSPKTLLKNNDFKLIQKFRQSDTIYVANWTSIRHDGRMIGGFAILRDITDYESMSTELDRITDISKELKAIIDSSFDGIFVTDGESTTLKVNTAYERITGVTREEVVGRTMSSLVEEGIYDESVTLRVLREKMPVTIVQHIMKTGKTVVVTGNPVFDGDGNIFRVVTNVRDVTELNQLQKKISKMEQLQSQYEIEIQQLRMYADDQKDFVIKSKKMKEVYTLALKLAEVDSTVLIQGDSGVGKEVVSEIIHRHGARRNRPFVKLSCAAIPENLLESELFGYAPGAFTGASKEGRAGVFELAHGGTIFLDEIGEMPMGLQVKLLRVLQEREVVRIGGAKPKKVDIRIMAATNRDLEQMVREKLFRKDLFYRLNVVPVVIPPLCERKEAISHFVYFFLRKHNKKQGLSKQITTEALEVLVGYDWPGNVRELENMVEQLLIMAQGEVITVEALPTRLRTLLSPVASVAHGEKPFKVALEEFECRLLKGAIDKHGSSRKVAKALGINQSTVVRKANRFGIQFCG